MESFSDNCLIWKNGSAMCLILQKPPYPTQLVTVSGCITEIKREIITDMICTCILTILVTLKTINVHESC